MECQSRRRAYRRIFPKLEGCVVIVSEQRRSSARRTYWWSGRSGHSLEETEDIDRDRLFLFQSILPSDRISSTGSGIEQLFPPLEFMLTNGASASSLILLKDSHAECEIFSGEQADFSADVLVETLDESDRCST
jgi:hypothetical protein